MNYEIKTREKKTENEMVYIIVYRLSMSTLIVIKRRE